MKKTLVYRKEIDAIRRYIHNEEMAEVESHFCVLPKLRETKIHANESHLKVSCFMRFHEIFFK